MDWVLCVGGIVVSVGFFCLAEGFEVHWNRWLLWHHLQVLSLSLELKLLQLVFQWLYFICKGLYWLVFLWQLLFDFVLQMSETIVKLEDLFVQDLIQVFGYLKILRGFWIDYFLMVWLENVVLWLKTWTNLWSL